MNSFQAHITVATVVEQDGRLLFVRETQNGETVINQPAGHAEFGEDLMQAAYRETLEETGMDLCRHGRYVTRLSDLITRHHSRLRPMVVTPYVFEWHGPKTILPNHEVERAVWVPLDYLAAGENQSQLPWRTPLGTLNMPCCRYQDACIWGLSYSMLQELLTAGINAKSKIC